MNKKEYIIKVLNALMEYRPLARGMKILIEGDVLDDTTIDKIITTFDQTIRKTTDIKIKNKFQESKKILEKIKKIEEEHHGHDKKTLDELDQMMQNI